MDPRQRMHPPLGSGLPTGPRAPPSSAPRRPSIPSLQSQQHPAQLQPGVQQPLRSYPSPPSSTSSRPSQPPQQPRQLRPERSIPSLRDVRPTASREPMPARPKLAVPTTEAAPEGVMERMQRAGWGEVGAEKGEEVEGSRGGSISSGGKGSFSEDSGYGETQEGEGGYLGQWSRLKKVVWGEGEGLQELGSATSPVNSPPHDPHSHGSQLWDRLLAASAVVFATVTDTVARARGEEDDGRLDEEGNTKLSWVIKEYYISRADSLRDLPTWLFSPAELANRSAPPQPSSIHTRSTSSSAPTPSNTSATARNYASTFAEERKGSVDEYDRGAAFYGGSRGAEVVRESSGSRTTDKLRAMRDAKRMR